MRRRDWGGTLRGLLLRWVAHTMGAVVVLAAIGFALAGWDGVRNGALFGLLAGGLALPFVLGAIVDLRGGGVEDAGHAEFYERWYGERRRGPGD
ncbi:MAG: hypothetical protein LH477_18675 [Nocardioides sp.]|nr:hypothetical protein [Nocardioides sp.]